MTEEMLALDRENQRTAGVKNVGFLKREVARGLTPSQQVRRRN
jgi:hypothetical protein